MSKAWLDGYEFALRNLRDEAVQSDLRKLTAGVNDEGAFSVPPRGAGDALIESKGAAASAPAPAFDYAGIWRAAVTLAHEYAAAIDSEHGCCHTADDFFMGGREVLDEWEPITADCPGRVALDGFMARLRAALERDGGYA